MINEKNIPVYYGLYGESDFLLTDFVHCEAIGYRTKLHNLVIEEHIHTSVFQVFILESGRIDMSIGEQQYLLTGTSVITVPENILHGMRAGKNIKGKVVTISSSFLESNSSNFSCSLHDLSHAHVITAFPKMNSFETIRMLADNLCEEINVELPEKKWVLQNYCNLLLSLICRLSDKKSERVITPDNRNMRYFKIFQKSVRQSCTPMKSIKEYAHELNITGVHLNRICKSAVGKSALQIVHEFLVLEAEKFLQDTDLHVAEIAYRLNFEDPAYFSRLFRKYTGTSPRVFREKNYHKLIV